MSIVNRRNAFMGWAVWTVGKQVMKRKAKAAVPIDSETKRPKRVAVALGAIAGVAATVFFWRRHGEGDDAAEPMG
jgi:hypothetical protein